MQNYLPKSLPDFRAASIIVVGDIMLDRYWFGDTARVSPEAPVPIVKINNEDYRPGGASNVALNIAALGARTTLLGITGKDEASQLLTQQLDSANVIHDLCQIPDVKTIIKLRVISRHQQLLRMDFEETISLTKQNDLLTRYQQHLSQCNLVILSDYKKGTLADPQTLIQLAHQQRIPVLVDPKGTDFSIYKNADIITPNLKEFEAVVGRCHNEQEILAKGKSLLSNYGFRVLLITRGEEGMTLIQANECLHLPAYAREVFDVTGAGDTVIATLGTAIAAKMDLPSATALSNLAASLAVAKLGATSVTRQELQAALKGAVDFNKGILNEDELLTAVKEARSLGKRIIFTNGCFDVLHAGHVTYLNLAKQLGDYLIVAVNSDESIRKLKGPQRPINNIKDRMTVLAGLEAVDWVIPFADDTPERLLRLIQPHVLVKGSDYELHEVIGADIVNTYGGDVRIMKHNINFSSSALIQKIQSLSVEEMSA